MNIISNPNGSITVERDNGTVTNVTDGWAKVETVHHNTEPATYTYRVRVFQADGRQVSSQTIAGVKINGVAIPQDPIGAIEALELANIKLHSASGGGGGGGTIDTTTLNQEATQLLIKGLIEQITVSSDAIQSSTADSVVKLESGNLTREQILAEMVIVNTKLQGLTDNTDNLENLTQGVINAIVGQNQYIDGVEGSLSAISTNTGSISDDLKSVLGICENVINQTNNKYQEESEWQPFISYDTSLSYEDIDGVKTQKIGRTSNTFPYSGVFLFFQTYQIIDYFTRIVVNNLSDAIENCELVVTDGTGSIDTYSQIIPLTLSVGENIIKIPQLTMQAFADAFSPTASMSIGMRYGGESGEFLYLSEFSVFYDEPHKTIVTQKSKCDANTEQGYHEEIIQKFSLLENNGVNRLLSLPTITEFGVNDFSEAVVGQTYRVKKEFQTYTPIADFISILNRTNNELKFKLSNGSDVRLLPQEELIIDEKEAYLYPSNPLVFEMSEYEKRDNLNNILYNYVDVNNVDVGIANNADGSASILSVTPLVIISVQTYI